MPEARFCRRCGATLRADLGDAQSETGTTSATLPLVNRPATTADLSSDEAAAPERTDSDTSDPYATLGGTRSNGGRERAEEFDPERTIVAIEREEVGAPDFGDEGERTVRIPRRVEPLGSAGGATGDDSERLIAPARPHGRRWPLILALCSSFLLFTMAGAWFLARYMVRNSQVNRNTLPPATPPPPDRRQLFEDKLSEAESLLAQGDLDAALARLREANVIDPANTRAHRRLGEILFDTGARRAAVEEFRAVTRNAPQDFTAWRQLAAAQFAEALYRDAAESYRRVLMLVGEQNADPQDLLSYADALRLSNRPEEARAYYERLAATPYTLVADAARARLAEMPSPTPSPTPSPVNEDPGAGTQGTGGTTTPAGPDAAPTPAPQPTPVPPTGAPAPRPPAATSSERYLRGVELWPTNRAAAAEAFRAAARAGNPDAHYYLGLGYVLGRNLRALRRAEVVAALEHFQQAERGQFAEQSRRYARLLEQEFDRLQRQ